MDEKTLQPVNVFVRFPPALGLITGQEEMRVVMNDGAPFLFLLSSVLTSYPEIQRRYPPGKLGFTLNNRRPMDNDILHEGDTVTFFV